MVTSTLTTWQKAFYIETLVTFVFKYRNLCKSYSTYLLTVTILIAAFCLAMLRANGVVQSSPDPLRQAPEPPRRAPKRPVEQEDCQSSEEDGDDDDDDEEEKALLVSAFA